MATENVAASLIPVLFRESTMGHDPSLQTVRVGDFMGLSFPKLATQGYVGTFQVPSGTLTTGLTFNIATVDDGTNADDLGKVVRFGITVKRLIDAETTDMDTAAATEATVDVTLETTSQNVTVNTLAIANAALDSLAVGNFAGVRIRRIGTHANDTCNGRVAVIGFSVYAT